MFLFGCFINFVPYTHTYEYVERHPRSIRHPSHLLLCPHMHHDSPIITSPTRKQTLSRSKVSYMKGWASVDRAHLGASYRPHYALSRQSAPRYPSSSRRRKWTDSLSSGDQIIQMSSFIDIAAPTNPFLSGNALDKAPSPRPTSESHHIRTRRNLMLCSILISRPVYRSRLTFRMVHFTPAVFYTPKVCTASYWRILSSDCCTGTWWFGYVVDRPRSHAAKRSSMV